MSNYRRFITYLFRYEDGEKKEQCGYAKVEQRQNTGRIEIHLKNCHEGMVEVRPYFFAREVRVPIGRLPVKNRMADGSFRFDCLQMGKTSYGLQDMKGVIVPFGDREVLFGQWDDAVYPWKDLLGAAELSKNEKTEQRAIQNEIFQLESEKTEADGEESDLIHHAVHEAAKDEARHDKVSDEILQKTGRNDPQRDATADLSIKLQNLRPKIYPFQGDLSTWAIHAQLRDVRYLPKEYWHLGNNSFVLRGYFNYGNILIGYMEEEQRWFIGVPGIFYKQEKIIASMFGFTYFRGKKDNGERPGEFGYWYQLLNMVR